MNVPPIRTPRFELVSMSMAFMRALVDRDLAGAEVEIGALVPAAMADDLDDYLRARIAEPPADAVTLAWLGRAIVLTDPDGTRRVVGSCGFHAPPGPDRRAEVGCSVASAYRRQRVGTEVLEGLFDWALTQGVDGFRASIAPDNVGSIAMVRRLGFHVVGLETDAIDGDVLIFELDGWSPAGRAAAQAERTTAGAWIGSQRAG